MSTDDRINIAILVAALVLSAWLFPTLVNMDRDAELGASVRQLMGDR